MAQKYDVVGVGNAIVDILAKVEDSFLEKHSLPKGGMILIDEEKAKQLYDAIPSAVEASGGSAANTLAGIASLGGTCAFIGKVKNDELGQIFSHDIRSIGVDYKTLAASEGPATAKCLVSITPDAERTMATYLGATRYLTTVDIDAEMIADSKVVYFEGYLWDEEEAKDAIRKAMSVAKQNGCKVAFSLSDLFCVERHRIEFLQLVEEQVDILFCNEDEAFSLVQEEDLELAIAALSSMCQVVVITRGAHGSIVAEGAQHHITPCEGLDVVDTTGAGDLYAAGFLYAYTQGQDLASCGRIGTLAASEIIQHIGARPQESLAELVKNAA